MKLQGRFDIGIWPRPSGVFGQHPGIDGSDGYEIRSHKTTPSRWSRDSEWVIFKLSSGWCLDGYSGQNGRVRGTIRDHKRIQTDSLLYMTATTTLA